MFGFENELTVGLMFKFKKDKFEQVSGEVRKKNKKENRIFSNFFNQKEHIDNNNIITIRNIDRNNVYFSVNHRRNEYLSTTLETLKKLYRNGNLIII